MFKSSLWNCAKITVISSILILWNEMALLGYCLLRTWIYKFLMTLRRRTYWWLDSLTSFISKKFWIGTHRLLLHWRISSLICIINWSNIYFLRSHSVPTHLYWSFIHSWSHHVFSILLQGTSVIHSRSRTIRLFDVHFLSRWWSIDSVIIGHVRINFSI
jgi:hypothetical protein